MRMYAYVCVCMNTLLKISHFAFPSFSIDIFAPHASNHWSLARIFSPRACLLTYTYGQIHNQTHTAWALTGPCIARSLICMPFDACVQTCSQPHAHSMSTHWSLDPEFFAAACALTISSRSRAFSRATTASWALPTSRLNVSSKRLCACRVCM
jgi:hypothetical protein